jgi:hypothetical protein
MTNRVETHVNIVPVNSFSDVNKENKFSYLNQKGFVRTQTASEQWILLVNDAWSETGFPANELMRDYLSLMLERYMLRNDLYQKLMIFNYIQHLLEGDNIDPLAMQEIADISLQYVSFVPARSENRHQPRSLRYSTSLGEDLYNRLAVETEDKDDWFSLAYREMSRHFGSAIMILRSIKSPFQGLELVNSEVTIPTTLEAKDMVDQYLLCTQRT